MSRKSTPINTADVLRRASAVLSGPKEPGRSAKDAMKNVKVSKEDPLVQRIISSR